MNRNEDEDIFEEDEELSRKKIAACEYNNAIHSNYEVGYQGALIDRLE